MRTKNLLFATALVASFAACSNEDLFDAPQNVAKDGRPTVSDVKLNFAEAGAQTRLTFGRDGYAWEESDIIGALLMDQVGAPASLDWNLKYILSKYVNTSYPFTYDPAEKIWSSNAKMLEGNYFFAFPWSSYDGARQVKHSLTEQKQKGVSSSVVAQSYADNQLFIGYAQIKGGTEAADALENVEMTSVLGAIQLRIINEGSKTYHINKIVLSGTDVVSEFTFDPTNAAYAEGNITQATNVNCFNYANYLGLTNEGFGNYTATANYKKMAALRAVAQASGAGTSATLLVEGTAEERAVAQNATAYALVMTQPASITTTGQLKLAIYTDEGVITNIDLSVATTSGDKQNSPKVTTVGPDKSNTVVVKFNDEALESVQTSDIYTTADLKQLITWNINTNIAVDVTAELKEDVVLTKEVFDLLKTNNLVTLKVQTSAGKALILNEDLPANVLEYGKLNITTATEVKGEIALTKNTAGTAIANLTVAEGGVVSVNAADAIFPVTSLSVEGTLNIGADAIIAGAEVVTVEEGGVVNVAAGADVKATGAGLTNNGILNNNGYMEGVTNNAHAVINVGENAVLKGLDNAADGTVNVAKGAMVSGTNAGTIICADRAVDLSGVSGGKVAIAATGSLAKDGYKNSGINTLMISGETTVADDLTDINNLVLNDGTVLKVAAGKTLDVSSVDVKGGVTLASGNLTSGSMTVAKNASLTNKGNLVVKTTWSNNGIVYNHGTAQLPSAVVTAGSYGTWKYAAPTAYVATTPTTTYQLVVTINSGVAENTSAVTGAAGDKSVTFQNLKRLHTFVTTTNAGTSSSNIAVSVKSISIESDVALANDDYASGTTPSQDNHVYYLKQFNTAAITLKKELSGLDNAMNLTLGTVTCETGAKITGTLTNVEALTVNKLIVKDATTITDMDLKISGTQRLNDGCANIVGDNYLIFTTSRIVGYDANGNKMKWDDSNHKWIAL